MDSRTTFTDSCGYLHVNINDKYFVYYPNTLPCKLEQYKNNCKDGLCKYWYPDGKLWYEVIYDNGVMIKLNNK
jgi:antitoxin component YwqK of YwqJK toxin-antitoxin module